MPVYSPIMLALCSMLLVTYYASNYAGIIGLGLPDIHSYMISSQTRRKLILQVEIFFPLIVMAGTGFCHMVVVATFAMSQEVHVSNLQIFLMKLASYLANFYKKICYKNPVFGFWL